MPNLAIAEELKSHCGSNRGSASRGPIVGQSWANCGSVEFLYVGSRAKLDRKLVEPSGIPFKTIFTGKIRRYFAWQNFIDPVFVLLGFLQSFWILLRFWPHAVFTKGGFVSVPVAIAAWILRRPIVLHESDSVMGLANRIVARLAKRVCLGFPNDQFPNDQFPNSQFPIPNPPVPKRAGDSLNSKYVLTGNPVRQSILHGSRDKGFKLTHFIPGKPVVLVWGGSQGAQQINDLISGSFEQLKGHFQILHITGQGKQTELDDPAYCQFEYLDKELKHIYAITDVVVGRAGANSLYELALMQKPNILIPLKSAAHNHQQFNAEYFEEEGAGLILRDESLYDVLNALWHNPKQLESMKHSLSRLAKPKSAEEIAELILKL